MHERRDLPFISVSLVPVSALIKIVPPTCSGNGNVQGWLTSRLTGSTNDKFLPPISACLVPVSALLKSVARSRSRKKAMALLEGRAFVGCYCFISALMLHSNLLSPSRFQKNGGFQGTVKFMSS